MDNAPGKHVIVIGAGIVGASLAYHLTTQGAKVTVVEAEGIASGVTGSSFAWINSSHGEPDPIAPLRGAAIQEYRRLETQLPGLKIQWTGALSYGPSSTASANRISRSQIRELEPNLKNPPQQASYAAEEGALDAVAATHALIAGAQANGAKVLTQTPVLPADDIPIIGYLPQVGGVYVCVMHPGVTLAAIVGRLASEEIVGDKACSALNPCRPDRFFQA
ncbi:NAD(P)/FAD-dependent oxidoreductase [Pseudomonas brassicacearum]|uniref:FAD-binding oxidoreductase n=1 Tax=Pseudomonas brassicacearum TaxID=930166 RepID=A0AAJ3FT62_9PSED|nr:FAD-dependent oxidoreductase [Pseudomonas brassicacearum]NUT79372.1 FAD-binding oxidoreductase [Pseudomonas brassicacearum]